MNDEIVIKTKYMLISSMIAIIGSIYILFNLNDLEKISILFWLLAWAVLYVPAMKRIEKEKEQDET